MLYMKLNFKEYIIGVVVLYYWVFVGFLCVFVYVMCFYIVICFMVKKIIVFLVCRFNFNGKEIFYKKI